MKKRNTLLGTGLILGSALTAFILSACAGSPEKNTAAPPVPAAMQGSPAWLWDCRPSGSTITLVAAGKLRSNRNLEAYAALEKAAMYAGVFAGFWGANQDYVSSNVSGTGSDSLTRAHYNGPAADAALEQLEAVDLWRHSQATWAKFTLDVSSLPPLNWAPEMNPDGPKWMRVPPVIPGWHVTVGLGGPQSTLVNTIGRAEEDALAQIVSLIHGKSLSLTTSREAASATYSESSGTSTIYERGFGEIFGFLVIGRWVDDKGQGWALAVAPVDRNTF